MPRYKKLPSPTSLAEFSSVITAPQFRQNFFPVSHAVRKMGMIVAEDGFSLSIVLSSCCFEDFASKFGYISPKEKQTYEALWTTLKRRPTELNYCFLNLGILTEAVQQPTIL